VVKKAKGAENVLGGRHFRRFLFLGQRMSLISSVKFHEGLELKPYKCSAGVQTIGYGRSLERGITKEEAEILLLNDLKMSEHEAKRFNFYHGLTGNRKDVVVEMIFNLGLSRFMLFTKTIIAIENKDFAAAADEMLDSRWAEQVGERAVTLSNKMRG